MFIFKNPGLYQHTEGTEQDKVGWTCDAWCHLWTLWTTLCIYNHSCSLLLALSVCDLSCAECWELFLWCRLTQFWQIWHFLRQLPNSCFLISGCYMDWVLSGRDISSTSFIPLCLQAKQCVNLCSALYSRKAAVSFLCVRFCTNRGVCDFIYLWLCI